MGLTIHYGMKSRIKKTSNVRARLEQLRQRALDLPFEEVGEIHEFVGEDCDFEKHRGTDNLWLLIQSSGNVEYKTRYGHKLYYTVQPDHVMGFSTWPGEGCEEANFGFCHYPETMQVEFGETIPTNLKGWRWSSFCKTQYATNPECGGIQNFLRCHLCVIRMLDHARELKILDGVSDEGDYWEKRDLESLAREVGEWNTMIAGFFGAIKDNMGDDLDIVSEIHRFFDFEHLEAEAQVKIA